MFEAANNPPERAVQPARSDTVTLDGPVTIGSLIFGDTTPGNNWTLTTGTAGTLTLRVTSGTPSITVHNQTTTISAVLEGNQGLVKSGAGKLTLSSENTYTGDTTVNSGTLSVSSPYLGDSSTVMIASGAKMDLASGTALDIVGRLILDGNTVPPGIYNSSHLTYGACFTGTGSLVASGYSSWASANGPA